MFYAALDVSLRSIAVCIIDHEGKVRLERSIPSEIPDLIRCLQEFGEPVHQVGLEAGTLTQHLTYGLVEAGFDVVCMEARQVNAALSAMRNKTDRHDARGIAQILRAGWYSRVHVKSLQSHYTRALLTSCKVMQRGCIDLENEICGILKVFGVKLPLRLSRGAFDRAVRETIETDPGLSHALLPMLQARQVLFDTFAELDRRVRRAAQDDAVCRRFMGVPSVGEITALSFKAAVDDPDGQGATLRRTHASDLQWDPVDLRLHDAADGAVPFRAAPHLALRPKRQRPQLLDLRTRQLSVGDAF